MLTTKTRWPSGRSKLILLEMKLKKYVLLASYHVTENQNLVLRISCFVVKDLTRAIVNNTYLISLLLRYLEQEHFKSCPSETYLNGLGKLPLGTEFADHSQPDGSRPTTQKLPTGQPLSGSKTFETLLKYFTTLEITPTQLREQASKILHQLYDEVDNVCFSLIININLLVVYRESVNLIGYITRRLSADSLQL